MDIAGGKITQIRKRRAAGVTEANGNTTATHTPRQQFGKKAKDVISFEHKHVNGIKSHDNFVKLTNTIGTLDKMEAGVYNMVETQWDTTCPRFCKMIRQKNKKKDTYAKVFLR